MSKRTSMGISDETRQRLARLGVFGESLEDVVKKLLDFYESKN